MKVNDQHYHTIWVHPTNSRIIRIIDQRSLPHQLIIENLTTVKEAAAAIREMHVRGAPLIGVAAAYGMYLACLENKTDNKPDDFLQNSARLLKSTRPTAVNLAWAVDQQLDEIKKSNNQDEKIKLSLNKANQLKAESIKRCFQIGQHGLSLIENIYHKKNEKVVNVLTHCNAGWLACIDHGTATAPIYAAHDKGIPVHVWVDETRPRNQGARITAWELQQHGVPYTVITDNTGGHLMQHGMVDLVIVGTDRTTCRGDVANKIGTYLKALAAFDNGVPFYVGAPSSSIDWNIVDGLKEIPIEEREGEEVKYIQGSHDGTIKKVLLTPNESPVANFAFDVTPARLVTGLITEKGICEANEKSLRNMFEKEKTIFNERS